jgi:hypothetical protein
MPYIRQLLRATGSVGLVCAQDMAPEKCGECHESQFQTWLEANTMKEERFAPPVTGFPFGSLNGCKSCHTGKHNVQFKIGNL